MPEAHRRASVETPRISHRMLKCRSPARYSQDLSTRMGSYSTYKPENTRLHVIAAKAFGLGAVAALCTLVVVLSETSNAASYRLSLFTLFQCIFHTLEFFITAIYNTEEADDDSFILGDRQLHYAYIAAMAESVLKLRFSFFAYNKYYLIAGVLIVTVGQICRSLAMYTAGVSFNHHIQQEHAQKHKLVTGGIYLYSRHPSYFGYFWWYVGTQLVLQNWVVAALGVFKLLQFFTSRIEYEEKFLVSFFGDEYKTYRGHTGVGIPFIK